MKNKRQLAEYLSDKINYFIRNNNRNIIDKNDVYDFLISYEDNIEDNKINFESDMSKDMIKKIIDGE